MQFEKGQIYLPVLLDITNRNILIIGAGNACREKLNSLGQLGKEITVISPEFHIDFTGKPWLKLVKRNYQKGDLKGFDIVYAGINNPEIEKQILMEAREQKILVNFVDQVEYSDFISPSLIRKDNFSIFISTYGKGPGAAKRIRKEIESKINLDQVDSETREYIMKRNLKKSEL